MEVPAVLIVGGVVEKINKLAQEHEDPCHGFLFGSHTSADVTITAACYIAGGLKAGNFMDNFLRTRCMFPIGADPIGVFFCNCSDADEVSNIVPVGANDMLAEDLICANVYKATTDMVLYQYSRFTKAVHKLEYTRTDSDPFEDCVLARLSCSTKIEYKFSTKKAELDENICRAVEASLATFGMDDVYFEILLADIVAGASTVLGAQPGDTIEKAIKGMEKKLKLREQIPKWAQKSADHPHKLLYVDGLTDLTNDKGFSDTSFSPIIRYKADEELIINIVLPIYSVVILKKSEELSNLAPLFYRSIKRQVHAAKYLLTTYTGTEFPCFDVYHFWVDGMCYPLSFLLPSPSKDSDLVEWRKDLHTKLMLPLDRPHFRLCNTYVFPKEKVYLPQLINPHIGLSHTKQLKDTTGDVCTVYGKYAYHHYMQDKFDDDKWGCAYRSLQTLISWFNLQGYSDISIPTHRDIQQVLVDIGDKEPSFVGSRQWIGSTEVSFVLDKLLNVTSKILFVSSGGEMASKGRELMQHFQTQGTPIMIGGGVLAHTILGVYYNDQTGDIKFLILDPHYTGGEDLKLIQDKGWCGWKGPDYWDKTAYYNMCMPQRPIEF